MKHDMSSLITESTFASPLVNHRLALCSRTRQNLVMLKPGIKDRSVGVRSPNQNCYHPIFVYPKFKKCSSWSPFIFSITAMSLFLGIFQSIWVTNLAHEFRLNLEVLAEGPINPIKPQQTATWMVCSSRRWCPSSQWWQAIGKKLKKKHYIQETLIGKYTCVCIPDRSICFNQCITFW